MAEWIPLECIKINDEAPVTRWRQDRTEALLQQIELQRAEQTTINYSWTEHTGQHRWTVYFIKHTKVEAGYGRVHLQWLFFVTCHAFCHACFFTISVSTLSLGLFCLSFCQPVSMFLFCASFFVWFYSFSPCKTEQYVHSNRNGRDLNTLLHHISGAATVAYLLHNFPHIFASNFAEVKAHCLNGVCMKKTDFSAQWAHSALSDSKQFNSCFWSSCSCICIIHIMTIYMWKLHKTTGSSEHPNLSTVSNEGSHQFLTVRCSFLHCRNISSIGAANCQKSPF